MKSIFFLRLAVVFACFFMAAKAVQAKQVVAVTVPVKSQSGAPAAGSFPNPLDELYRPTYAYVGTNIPINVVPISIFPAGKKGGASFCTAFRITKYWMITAAHCLEPLGTQDHRVHVDIEEIILTESSGSSVMHKAKGFEVAFSPVEKDNPPNASLYFYRQGYSTDGSSPRFGYSFAEDIALIRLDEKDPSYTRARSMLRQTKETLGEDTLAAMSAVYGGDILGNAERQITVAETARKKFFGQKLNEYTFFVTPPEGTFHYDGHTGYGYFFGTGSSRKERGFPKPYAYRFQGLKDRGSHELQWSSDGPKGISGSPIIMNRFVVSNTSGADKGYMQTPLYSVPFEAFLRRAMGKEYPQKLCLSPILEGSVPVREPNK